LYYNRQSNKNGCVPKASPKIDILSQSNKIIEAIKRTCPKASPILGRVINGHSNRKHHYAGVQNKSWGQKQIAKEIFSLIQS
jgi:hypothetical protein